MEVIIQRKKLVILNPESWKEGRLITIYSNSNERGFKYVYKMCIFIRVVNFKK